MTGQEWLLTIIGVIYRSRLCTTSWRPPYSLELCVLVYINVKSYTRISIASAAHTSGELRAGEVDV